MLKPYIKNTQLFKCPSDFVKRDDCGVDRTGTGVGYAISYSWTHYYSADETNCFGVCPYYIASELHADSPRGSAGGYSCVVRTMDNL